MENKKTAVEWLEDKLNSVKPTQFCSIETIKEWIEQAKQIEKEQIIDAYDQMRCVGNFDNGQQYYNETWKIKT